MKRPTGMAGFTIVWLGQVISMIGTSLSGFALTIWAWQATGSATALAVAGICFMAPNIIFVPIAGALVDRWNRKLVMMLSDLAAVTVTIFLLVLNLAGVLQIWHLFIGNFITGTFQAFQWPAYSAAISLMIPKKQYSRAAGMMSFAEWGTGVFSPVLAGALIGIIGLSGILTIDIATFVIAISALLWITVPQPAQTEEGRKAQGSIWKESVYGFRYIWQRKPLLGLQLVFFFGNFFAVFAGTLATPMILARTGNNALLLGTVQSIGSIGGILGSLLMTAWGGPKLKVYGVVIGWFFTGLLGTTLVGLGQGIAIWGIGMFFHMFIGPIVNSSNQAIWQSKVAPDIQGRVFSARRLIAQVSIPIAPAIAGPLADYVMEPAMQTADAPLAPFFSFLTGVGPGTGMALVLIFVGLLIGLVAVVGLTNPLIRHVESLIPDHTQEVKAENREPQPSSAS